MLIRSQSGEHILRAHSVTIDHYGPAGMYALLASDELNPEGVVVALYDTRTEADVVLDYIFRQASQGKPADLKGYEYAVKA